MAKNTRAARLHRQAVVIDLVCPLLAQERYLDEWIAGGATCVGPTVASDHTLEQAMGNLAAWYERFRRLSARILHVTRVEDVRRAKREGKLGVLFHFPKTFNAAAAALLVEAGQLRWDTPVVDVLPGFRLADPTVTPHVLVQDLVGQSIGFGEDNIMNYHSRFSRAEIVGLVRTLPLRVPFRSECAYQQFGPLVAGAIVERLAGMAWEDFVERELCATLGLGDTRASYFRLPDRAVACDGHLDRGDGAPGVIPHRNFNALAPTGARVSSLRNMEPWFSLFAGGAIGGTRLLGPGLPGRTAGPRDPRLSSGGLLPLRARRGWWVDPFGRADHRRVPPSLRSPEGASPERAPPCGALAGTGVPAR